MDVRNNRLRNGLTYACVAFNQSEISLPREGRGGKILVTAGVGSSGEGGVNRKDPNFIFGVMGIKFCRLFTSPKIIYWICKILSGVMF